MKVRLVLKSFNQNLIEEALEEIASALASVNCTLLASVSLPPKKKRFCVIRSPHIDKHSREHFEICLYKQIIDVSINSFSNLDSICKIDLPSGVSCFFKILET